MKRFLNTHPQGKISESARVDVIPITMGLITGVIAVLLGLGLGFFLSALLSWKLSKTYGLVDSGRTNGGDVTVTGS